MRAQLAFGSVILALLAAGPVSAKGREPTTAELRAQIDALTKRVSELEAAAKSPPPAPASSAAGSTAPPDESAERTAEVEPGPQSGGVPVAARPKSDDNVPGAVHRTRDERVAVAAAPLDRALQGLGSAIEINASKDSSQVKMALTSTLSTTRFDESGKGLGNYSTLGFTASAPLNKSGDFTDLATLDGFANSFNLKLRWSSFRLFLSEGLDTGRDEEIEELAVTNCRKAAGQDQGALKACAPNPIDDAFIRTWAGVALQDEYLSIFFPDKMAFGFGLEGTIGYRKFQYLDAAAIALRSNEKIPWGLRAYGSLFPARTLASLTGAIEYQRAYEDQKAAIACPGPVANTPILCLEGPNGAPKQKDKILGSLELRNQFNLKGNGLFKSVGLSTQLTYDIESDAFGIDVPIYLVPDEKGRLIGGLRFGYRTDKDDFVVGVFVGSAFSLFQP
jgi:hypothetical protein